jgi:hypothetical protein
VSKNLARGAEVFFAKEGEVFGKYEDTMQVRLNGEEKMYHVLKADFDEIAKVTKAEATPDAQVKTQTISKAEQPNTKAAEAGQKSGTIYAYNLVGQYHVMKNEGKIPTKLPLSDDRQDRRMAKGGES